MSKRSPKKSPKRKMSPKKSPKRKMSSKKSPNRKMSPKKSPNRKMSPKKSHKKRIYRFGPPLQPIKISEPFRPPGERPFEPGNNNNPDDPNYQEDNNPRRILRLRRTYNYIPNVQMVVDYVMVGGNGPMPSDQVIVDGFPTAWRLNFNSGYDNDLWRVERERLQKIRTRYNQLVPVGESQR
jgi:hypothetical protein